MEDSILMDFKIKTILFHLLNLGLFTCSNGSGDTGRCKPITKSSNNAVTEDPDGKEWKLVITPAESALECEGGGGTISFTISIKDGQGIVKPGLGLFFGTLDGAFKVVSDGSTDVTDSCGLATLLVKWTCPTTEGQKQSTFLVVSSGALSSSSKISVEKIKPPTSVTTNTTNNNNGQIPSVK